MKKMPVIVVLLCLIAAAFGIVALFPGVLEPVAAALAIERGGLGSIASALFIATLVSAGLALWLMRGTGHGGRAALAGLLLFVLVIALWPLRIDLTKAPQADDDADSGFYVYRPVWRGPYLRMQRDEVHLDNLEAYRDDGSRWFGETLVTTWIDASEGAPYASQNIPRDANRGWSDADIRDIRGGGTRYVCIARREISVGPFTRVDIFTPTYHAAAFRRLCTPVSPG